MIISADVRIPFPQPLVYATFRDKLVELVPYLPNVRSIQVKSRHEEKGCIFSVNEWQGGGEIPVAARAILSEDMLSWTEYNTWNEAEFTLKWHIQTHAFTQAVHCSGTNRFIKEGGTTRIESRGRLSIDPKQIKGFPPFLIGGVARIVEEVLGSKIGPNLSQLSEGVGHYLESQKV